MTIDVTNGDGEERESRREQAYLGQCFLLQATLKEKFGLGRGTDTFIHDTLLHTATHSHVKEMLIGLTLVGGEKGQRRGRRKRRWGCRGRGGSR